MFNLFKKSIVSLFLPNFYYFLALLKSFKIIFKGKLSNYTGLSPLNALNQFFYIVQNINIRRFSRQGISPLIGGGKCNLNNWWHIPNFSHYTFSFAPALSVLWGSLLIIIWLLFIDFFLNGKIFYSILPLFSTLFYKNVISDMNYNIFGLLTISPILYFLTNTDTSFFMLTSVLLVIISPTVFVIFSPIVFLHSFFTGNFLYFFSYCALCPLIFINFLYCKKENILSKFSWMLNAMGLTTNKSGLKRKELNFKNISLRDCYYFFSYLAAISCLAYIESAYTYFCIYIFIAHIVNRKLFKFSDDQNISAVFCITFITLLIISKNYHIYSFFLACIPLFEPMIKIEKIRPINTYNLISKLRNFVGNNKKPILLCFSNPKNQYNKVFSGQRILVEPISYICNKNERLLIPDWWAVFNKSNLDNFWVENKFDLMQVVKSFNISEFISTSKETDILFDKKFIKKKSFNWNEIYRYQFGSDLKSDLNLEYPVIWKKYKLK
jgi:hypothetical protein